MNTEEIKSCLASGVYEICIDRPRKRNALTHAMYGTLVDQLAFAESSDDVRVIYLRSAHEHFCGGNDLKDFLQTEFTNEANAIKFLLAMAGARKPIVSAVGGAVIGIGVTMLLHCDLVYAADTSQFSMPFIRLGLTPEGGSSKLLAARCGQSKANDWLLTGRSFDAKEALASGLVQYKCRNIESTWEAAHKTVTEMAGRSNALLTQTKEMIRPMPAQQTLTLIRQEAKILADRLRTEEAQNAIGAFFKT